MTLKKTAKLGFIFACMMTVTILSGISVALYFLNEVTKSGILGYLLLSFISTVFIFISKISFKSKFYLLLISVFLPYAGVAFSLYYCVFHLKRKNEKIGKVDLWVDKQRVLNKTGGNLTYFSEAEDGWNDFLKELVKAKYEVVIFSYIFEIGDSSSKLLSIIFDLLKKGVKVKLGVDYYGSGNIKRSEEIKTLQKLGMEVAVKNKSGLFLLPKDNVRWHVKVYVIDNKICYLPSFNIEDDSIKRDKNCCLKIKDGAFYGNSFSELFEKEELCVGRSNDYVLSLFDKDISIESVYLTAILKSEKSIKIITPFLSFSPAVFKALERSVLKGVFVTVILPSDRDKNKLDKISLKNARRLDKIGVAVRLYEGTFIHAKSILIDDFLCVTGSVNFDIRSAEFAVESFLVSVNNGLISPLLEDFNNVWEKTSPFLAGKDGINKFTDKISDLFSPLV